MTVIDTPSATAGPDWSQVSRDPYQLLMYGLASAVWTQRIDRALRVARAIKAGQVHVNGYYSPSMHETPMACQKQSGVGEAGLTKYMQSKAVFITLDAAH